MPSFTTVFRAAVMIVVGAIVFKGLQMYGPPAEKVKSMAVRAADLAQSAWKNFQTPDKADKTAAETQGAVPPLAALQPPAADTPIAAPPLSAQTLTPGPPMGEIPSASAPPIPPPITPVAQSAAPADHSDDRVKTLLLRLEQLGGADPKLSPWGSGGHLYRCCCQAPLANSPAVTKHFESVAAEPAQAVEEVVAKVEAWQIAQRGVLRY